MSAQAAPGSQQHIPQLDGIRGLAILMVVMSHYSEGTVGRGWEGLIYTTAQSGWIGVDLFFCLSGYLITGILLDTRDSVGYLRSFFMRRVLRIFPLYYVAVAIYFLFLRAMVTPGESKPHPLGSLHMASISLRRFSAGPTASSGPTGLLPSRNSSIWLGLLSCCSCRGVAY